ncbi:DUF4097 family beta strand repeat protein [Pontibacillus yanchengensis]|uniref:DUF4097 family beta strand repeat protein n=1 Tax=Pontibacillus yanchengensis TaxID=462910 RepID=A0A6I5A3F0_9BACI|nr:DUF4097 domain-containing protein [Pontibacillus yanchengensis]MYL34011.1 DUF4097 family beta strand repeat protein [Pontibacillus yanchengensis]
MQEERKRILKMLEEGMITSQEAEELIDSIQYAEDVQENAGGEEDEHQSLSTKVKWDEKQEQKSYQSGSTKKRFMDFVEETIKKVKNVDFDLNFGQYFEVSHIFQNQGVSFSKVAMDIANGSIELKPWQEDDVRIECNAKVYQVNNQDEARERFMDQKQYHVDDESLSFSISSKKIKTNVILYIPEKSYKHMSLRLFNGKIQSHGFHIEDLHAKTANGKVEFENMSGSSWDIETSNGSITLKDVRLNEVEVESLNGSITLDGEFEKVDTQGVNGSIKCNWHGHHGHKGFFKTTAGSITVALPREFAVDGELKTSMGSINCNLPNFEIQEEKSEVLKKELRFRSKGEQAKPLHLEAEAKTGSITIN